MHSEELERLRFDDGDGFDIALRRRTTDEHGAVFELVVNGMFAMDSVDSSSEVALADLVPATARRVLVGGLGLGFTAGALLDRLPQVQVDVAELSSGLIRWAREGLVPSLARVADDPRARLVHADVADLLRGAAEGDMPRGSSPSGNLHSRRAPERGTSEGTTRDEHGGPRGSSPSGNLDPRRAPERGTSEGTTRDEHGGPRGSSPSGNEYDAILLDVDNGPDFLIHDHNAALYGDDLLSAAAGRLAPGGLLAIWCEGETPSLHEALERLAATDAPGDTKLVTVPVVRDGHQIDYAIHCLQR